MSTDLAFHTVRCCTDIPVSGLEYLMEEARGAIGAHILLFYHCETKEPYASNNLCDGR